MIIIQEAEHRNLAGLTSLFLRIDRNNPKYKLICETLVDLTHYYDKKTDEFEVANTHLTYLIDNLSVFDDIKLNLLPDIKNESNEEPKLEYKVKPFPHQLDAIKYGLNHRKWLLLDAPGLGKTASIIHIAEELYAQGKIEHCFIICGINTLKENWKVEIQKHSNLSAMILGQKVGKRGGISYMSLKERAAQLREKIDEFFIITNIETFQDEVVVNAYLNSINNFGMLVCDEVHKIKNPQAIRTQHLLKLDAIYKIAATGTVLVNNPVDAYTPLVWIGKEKPRTLTKFKNTYCEFNSLIKGQISGFKNLEILKEEIESCSLRRTKDILGLPPKVIIDEYLDMEPKQQEFYRDITQGIIDEVDKVELNTANTLGLITRLRQATSCPSILTTNNIPACKLDRAIDLVEEITSNGDKVVIFSQFKEPVYLLQSLLKKYNPVIGTGDQSNATIFDNVKKFQEDDIHQVFIGTIDKLGTGLTLNRARYAIFIDLPWTSANYTQTSDRIHRIGTTESVFIYNLICKNTIDELPAKLIKKKEAFSNYIIDDKQDTSTLTILKNYIKDLGNSVI